MEQYFKIIRLAESLKTDFPKLTTFENLQIATQIQYAELLAEGLGIHQNHPAVLEAIAITLGYSTNSNSTILNALKSNKEAAYE